MIEKINKNSIGKIKFNKSLSVQIINNLGLVLDCSLELDGDNLTIWVSEKKEKENAKSN